MPKLPVISVVMPVYNASRYLRAAMDSILTQTFGDFEFLCVDDGSTDESPAILREYADRDSRVRIITKSNGGVTSALIAGVSEAKGGYVARMDADDIADPRRFELQVEHLRAHPECVAVGCHIVLIRGDGTYLEDGPIINSHEQIVDSLWQGKSGALPHFGAMIRTEALARVGGYNEHFRTAQDLDLFLRLSEIGRLENVPQPLIKYRVHEGGVSAARADEQAKNAREIMRQAYARKGLEVPKNLRRWDNLVVAQNRIKWGWLALEEGRIREARKHAWEVFRRAPHRKYAWQLALHALLGRQRHLARNLYRGVMKLVGRQPSVALPPVPLPRRQG
jgi:glycosyltransferase involved in cell wall biosynthesis